jgi:hypothetical protein
MSNNFLPPAGVTTSDLGTAAARWQNALLSGNLSDGTNAATVAALVAGAAAGSAAIPTTQKGAASGVAPLGTDSKINITYMPDVLRYYLGYFASLSALQTAYPTSNAGNYATVGVTGGNDAIYLWDAESGWVTTGGGGAVVSVNGQAGVVVLDAENVGAAPTSHNQDSTTLSDSTIYGRSLLTAESVAAQRTALGLGSAALLGVGAEAGTVAPGDGWNQTSAFATTAASTSTITMTSDLTGVIKVGMAIKFKLSGTYYYAVCSAITSNLLTIKGAPLTTGAGALTELYFSGVKAVNWSANIAGFYGAATSTSLLASMMSVYASWRLPKAYCVSFEAKNKTSAGTTQPKINLLIAGSRVSTANTNAGIQPSTSWVVNSAVAINTTNYSVANGEEIEIECTAAGDGTVGSTAASDLTLQAVFVME